MKRLHHTLYFSGFAAIAWGLTSLPYAGFLGKEFIAAAALCAAIAAALISWAVPLRWFQQAKFSGIALATGASLLISLASIGVAGVLFSLVTGVHGPISQAATYLLGHLTVVTGTLFVFPPSLIFWLIATVGIWWLHGRALSKRRALPAPGV